MAKKILLVEDEAILAMAEAKILKKRGYEVVTAYNGEKAVETADLDPEIDLILMDIDLGRGMDGTEAAQKILKEHNLPIVFLTSHSEEEYVNRVKKITNYGYVLKHSGEFVLVESINMAFHLYEAQKQLHTQKENLQTALTQKERSEEELQNHVERYQQLFNNINNCVAVYETVEDGSDFVIIDINKSVEKTENVRREDVLNKRVTEVFPGVRRFGLLDVLKRVAETGKPEHLPAAQYSDERIVGWRDNYVYKLPSGEIIATYDDVTERIKMEKSLRESERKYKSLYNSLRDALIVVNGKREIIDCNSAFTELFGYTLDEIRGQTTAIMYASNDDYEQVGRMMQEQGGDPNFIYRTRYCKKSGEVFWGEKKIQYLRHENGDPEGFVGLIRDVTEQIQREDELKRSEENYYSLFNQAVGGIYLHDFEGNIIDVNKVACEQTGYSKNELLQLSVFDMHVTGKNTINMSKAETKRIWRQSKVGERFSFELEHKHKDGTIFPVRLSTGTIRYGNRTIIMAIVEDITERKQQEEKLQKALEDKDSLMRELNHRVKNNLAMVSSLISLKGSEIEVDLSDLTHRIDAIKLVHDKLHQYNEVERIDVREYFQELLEAIFSSTANRNVHIVNNIEKVSIHPRTAVPLGIVINEIATNALKYGFTDDEEARFAVEMRKDSDSKDYILTLSNTGVAFPDEIGLENADTMGLQLVSSLVKQLSGTVELQKKPSPVFTIRFPAGEE